MYKNVTMNENLTKEISFQYKKKLKLTQEAWNKIVINRINGKKIM